MERDTEQAIRPHRRVFVDSVPRLREEAQALMEVGALGVDLEMGQRVERRPGGLQEWKNVLALIQVASDEVSLVIDPLRCEDLSSLGPVMRSNILKVFLGGGQDVALLENAGIPARTIIDVGEVALGIWGRREDGMAALSRRLFGLSLDKTVRRADWLARPLNPVLVAYAHQDAELTLMIYRWLAEHYPEATRMHQRVELDPSLPDDTAPWLAAAMRKPPSDVLLVLAEADIDYRDVDRLGLDVQRLATHPLSPRQESRLLRIAGELDLEQVFPWVEAAIQSPSSVVRAAAARTLGSIGTPDSATALLHVLRQDSVEDVRKAAEAGLKELKRPKMPENQAAGDGEESSSIDDSARSALEALLKDMESAGD